jgi:hypothetical protein
MTKTNKFTQIIIFLLVSIILLQFYLFGDKTAGIRHLYTNVNYFDKISISSGKTIAIQNKNNIEIFKQIALNHGTDKVTLHHYERLYGQLVAPIRFAHINFLEIGLGCGMHYGPGKSLPVWKEFMPNAKISILEFNEECARKFEKNVTHLFVGDQSDLSLLKKIGEKAGMFDVIVDDGGHSRKQQINSLIGLWPFIRNNGGIYIIEDIYTSFVSHFNDNNKQSTIDVIFELIVILNNPLLGGFGPPHILPSNFVISKHALDISKDLWSINCFEKACALIKK